MTSSSFRPERWRRILRTIVATVLLIAASPLSSVHAASQTAAPRVVPAHELASGTAVPSRSVAAPLPYGTTYSTLTVTASSQVYRPIAARTLTAHLDARLLSGEITGPYYDGYYRFKNNGVVFGTVGLDIFNEASIRVPTDLAPGTNDFTAEFVPTGDRLPSASVPLRYRTALVTPTVAVSARGVTLPAADQKRFGVTSGLIVTSTVKAPGSSYVPTGKVHVNIRGKVTTVTLSGGRGVSPVIPAAKGAVTIYSTFEPTSDPTLAIRALGRVSARVVR